MCLDDYYFDYGKIFLLILEVRWVFNRVGNRIVYKYIKENIIFIFYVVYWLNVS